MSYITDNMEPMESNRVRMLTIEWEMMDKNRFFGLTVVNSLAIRVFLYPLTVIKTRLQVQRHGQVYKGTFDAFKNIILHEGYSGLYKGFWVNTMQVVSGIGYIVTYEKVRHILSKNDIHDSRIKGLIAGGCGSLISQTIICEFNYDSIIIAYEACKSECAPCRTFQTRRQVNIKTRFGREHIQTCMLQYTLNYQLDFGIKFIVLVLNLDMSGPFDVISQHLMVLGGASKNKAIVPNGNKLQIDMTNLKRYGAAKAVVRELYRIDGGFKAYYRGYFSSVVTYVPSGALWWMFYPIFSGYLVTLFPETTSHMLIQCASGSLSGFTVAVLTNPLDVLRANIQVRRMGSFVSAARHLWVEERFNMFLKGLSARITQSCISSVFIVAGYETLKRLSLHEEYRNSIKW